jgi:hypothetical protein
VISRTGERPPRRCLRCSQRARRRPNVSGDGAIVVARLVAGSERRSWWAEAPGGGEDRVGRRMRQRAGAGVSAIGGAAAAYVLLVRSRQLRWGRERRRGRRAPPRR